MQTTNSKKQWPRRCRGHLAFLLAWLTLARPAAGAELVMFEAAGCMWCKQWHAEIGTGYANTMEGRRAPLRPHMLTAPPITNLALASPITVTPTFVLADKGREVGRISGHPGSDFFYPLLEELLKRLPDAKTQLPDPSVSLKNNVP